MPDRQATIERLGQLNESLGRQDPASLRLPDLAPRESWLEPYLERLREWISGLFPTIKLSPGSLEWMKLLLGALPYIIGVTLIVVLLFALSGFIRQAYRKSKTREKKSAPRPRLGLEPQLDQAIAAGNFPLAARLRWKLFLIRRREPIACTPKEFLRGRDEVVAAQYQLMFGQAPRPEPTYGELNGILAELEREKTP